jgi:SAM-dependent methyltransferase
MRLNLGCGRDIRDGWVNIDSAPLPGVEYVVDFDNKPSLDLTDDSVEYSEGSHVIEHLHSPLPFMQELWRVTKDGGTVQFRCPYGSSDDADEDPTHVRRMFPGSWGYFGQPHYWRADYGYRGDWQVEQIVLLIDPALNHLGDDGLRFAMQFQRNVVMEMVATLRAVKPAREPLRDLQQQPEIIIQRLKGT